MALALGAAVACGEVGGDDASAGASVQESAGSVEGSVSGQEIFRVQERHSREWLDVPGVVGTGIGKCDGALCIKVYVARRTPQVEERIPERVSGFPVRIEVTGPVRPRDLKDTAGDTAEDTTDARRAVEEDGRTS